MSRLKDAVLDKSKAYAGHSPVMNLAYGGQGGHTAAIGRIGIDGKNYGEWISNQAHVKQNVIPVVIDYPRAFDLMPDSQMWIDTYNALMTLHPLTIEGLASGLTVEFEEHALGGSGEFQEEVTKVTRARTVLAKTYKEKSGKAISKYIDHVIRYLYSDPDVERPLITTITDNDFGGLYTPDWSTGTNLYIEPDVTQRHVVDAWLCTNIMFKSNGERTGKRDVHTPRETTDLSIELTSITTSNELVFQLADKVLAKLNVLKTNPDLDMVVPSADVAAAIEASGSGFNRTPQPAA